MQNYVSGVDLVYSKYISLDAEADECERVGKSVDERLRQLHNRGTVKIVHCDTMKDAAMIASFMAHNYCSENWAGIYYLMPKQEFTHEA